MNARSSAPPRSHTLLFAPRFRAALVASPPVKRQTIRPPRRRPIRPGDWLSLRAWQGTAYRSPQIELRLVRCVSCEPIAVRIGADGRPEIDVAGVRVPDEAVESFVRADGFGTVDEFCGWWADHLRTVGSGERGVGRRDGRAERRDLVSSGLPAPHSHLPATRAFEGVVIRWEEMDKGANER